MAKEDKKRQAMSLLFGDAPARPARGQGRGAAPTEAEPPEAAAPPGLDEEPDAPPSPRAERSTTRAPRSVAPRPSPVRRVQADPYYEGQGVYRRRAGAVVKKSVYLEPEVWRAVAVAAASGDDPRGTSASEIIGALLKEAGYGG